VVVRSIIGLRYGRRLAVRAARRCIVRATAACRARVAASIAANARLSLRIVKPGLRSEQMMKSPWGRREHG